MGIYYFYFSFLYFIFFYKKNIFYQYKNFFIKIKTFFGYLFIISFVTGIVTQIMKHLFGRARPNYTTLENSQSFEFFNLGSNFHSFPSGHSSTIFAVALVFSAALPKAKYFFIFFASIVAFSRIAVEAHFFSDVLGGAIVAYICFKILIILSEKLEIVNRLEAITSINSNLFFTTILIILICSIYTGFGSSIDIFISSLFYKNDGNFILQNYDIASILVRKLFMVFLLLYLFILPLLSFFLPIKKIYFNKIFSVKEVLFIFVGALLNLIVIVNVLLKNLWGRARPNDIVELGGAENFTPWFELSNSCDVNCSFVSGDASVGFSLILFYFLTKNKFFIWGALFSGFLLGVIRILEGGHFLSDVFMACITIFIISFIQFYFFKSKVLKNVY